MDVLVLPLTISVLSPNHRLKPPSEHLNLDRESLRKQTLGQIAKQRVAHLSPRIAHQQELIRQSKPQPRDSPSQNIIASYSSCNGSSPQTCAQHWALQCAQVLLCNSETACQNEDWPSVFIVILANCLGRLLILGICLFNRYYYLCLISSLGG